ncbi:monoglyceride lipase-like [Tripterygium wilfordii]|uniref:Monoglyceride lipase-like n=1 Tax=Tripterygium wilfordii TaxID=458696 RepID=A0A7J7CKK9_TRIWF|nr:monoacylglycerol lipase-like [Tripterygium wilfordii]KAF5734594.1 monoglyceride lipase-like [Tripterygium wilfordii]
MICARNQTILIPREFQFVPILGSNRSSSYVKKRKSNWVSIGIRLSEFRPISFVKRPTAMESALKSNGATSTLILTSGVSGRVNALFSLRMWRSLLVLINAVILVLLLPFRCWKRAVVVTSSSSSSSSGEKMKDERSERKGPVVRVPAAIVSRRNSSSGGLSMAATDQAVAARRALAIRRVMQDDDCNSIRDFSLFVSSRGDTIFTQSWTPVSVKIRGLVVLLHGLNEHSGRYSDFAKALNANGFKVYGMDWIGHGGSDGLHAYVHSLDYAVSDMKSFLEKVLAENPGLPCFCFGHSTGGAIILKAILDPKVEAHVAGVVLTSPAVGVQPSHPIFTVLAPILSFLLPRYQFGAANKKGMPVSRDPEALVSKYSDPLVYTGSIRVRTGYEILRISSFLQQNLWRLRVPFLVLHGTADTVTDPGASQKLYEEASSTDKTIKLFDGLLHDLLFEPEREEIMRDIIEWFSCRL